MNSPLRFVSIGHGHVLCANKIYAVIRHNTAQGRRIMNAAKEQNKFFNFSCGKGIGCIIIMDDGTVIATTFSVQAIHGRLAAITSGETKEET